jgi:Ca-activated chloride channel homolog
MLRRSLPLVCLALSLFAGCAPQKVSLERTVDQRKNIEVARSEVIPTINASDLVAFESTTSNAYVRADKPGSIDVRLRIKAKSVPGTPRPPINVSVVVDTSASMEGSAIEDARKACTALLDKLSPGDRLALIAFHSGVDVLVPSTVLTSKNIDEIRSKISAMKPFGTTNLAAGLSAGLKEAQKNFQANGINRVVLLGDGVPNDATPLPALAQSAGQSQIAITTLGLGLDYDETVMSTIALNSGGKYHFIKESAKVAEVFQNEVLRLQRVVARGVSVRLATGPGVTIQNVVGLPMSSPSTVFLGDMIEGEERDVVVRLALPARRDGSVVEIMDAEVLLTHPTAPGQQLIERTFASVKSTTDAAQIAASRNRDVERSAARTDLADRIVRAVAAARSGNLPLAMSLLDTAEKEGKAMAKDLDDPILSEKVESLAALRRSLPSLVRREVATPVVQHAPGLAIPHKPMMAPPSAAREAAPSAASMAVVMDAQADAMTSLQGH